MKNVPKILPPWRFCNVSDDGYDRIMKLPRPYGRGIFFFFAALSPTSSDWLHPRADARGIKLGKIKYGNNRFG